MPKFGHDTQARCAKSFMPLHSGSKKRGSNIKKYGQN